MFMDDLTRIAVIWSSMAVFHTATGQALFGLGINPRMMLVCGYIGAFILMTVSDAIQVELIYVGLSAITCVMIWTGMHLGIRTKRHFVRIPETKTVPVLFLE